MCSVHYWRLPKEIRARLQKGYERFTRERTNYAAAVGTALEELRRRSAERELARGGVNSNTAGSFPAAAGANPAPATNA